MWLLRTACLSVLLVHAVLNARAQFAMQNSGTTADLRGIANVGNGTAWASGTHGTVLRTEDSGFVWQGCAVPPGAEQLDFRGVQAFDDQTAIVMSSGKGDLSRVYKTTDGCKTWKLVFTNPDAEGFFDAISFTGGFSTAPDQIRRLYASGVILGDPVGGEFAIFTTEDAGETWKKRVRESRKNNVHNCRIDTFTSEKGEAAYAASNQALLSYGGDHFLFVSGGLRSNLEYVDHFDLDFALCSERAKKQRLPLTQGASTNGSFAVARESAEPYFPLSLMIVGGDYAHPDERQGTAAFVKSREGFALPFTSDFIVSQPLTPPSGYRSSVAYDAATKTWITVGPNGTDVSTDDGKNWRALKPGSGDDADADKRRNALSLPYVVGPHGRIGRLRDDALAVGKKPR